MTDGAALCVLASGSSGNCSVLAVKRENVTRLMLIDLGLSPRRTFALLAGLGFGPHQIDDCFVTHLDHDHFHPGWMNGSQPPPHIRLRMHRVHAAELPPRLLARTLPFDSDVEIDECLTVRHALMKHDELGVTAMRFDFSGAGSANAAGGSLGFATDAGHVTHEVVRLMRDQAFVHRSRMESSDAVEGVDVLAIESNYCPTMQMESDRPEQLKRRIMGGRGHLSNQQALEAVHAIRPREHVVLLHLSRQCNDPSLVADLHHGADYTLTISSQHEPTRWIPVRRPASPRPLAPGRSSPAILKTATLWSMLEASRA